MEILTSTRITIRSSEEWYYTVEDENVVTSLDGVTISYWEDQYRNATITMEKEEAIAIANAIYKLFKKV